MPRDMAADGAVKPERYMGIYEELLGPLRRERFALLELGVWKGDSLQMWRDGFSQATVVGVDLDPPSVNLGPRVHVERGDATDPAFLRAVRERHAPDGFEVIVDDASHEAGPTAASLAHLFANHLRPGGLYLIEDWGTGYVAGFPDGAAFEGEVDAGTLGPGPGHDHGMVGLVKRLVDHVAAPTIAMIDSRNVGRALDVDSIVVRDGIVALRKRRV